MDLDDTDDVASSQGPDQHMAPVRHRSAPLPTPPDGEDISKINGNIIAQLENILQDTSRYKQLLACKGTDAQTLLNTFQTLLDKHSTAAPFRRSLVVALRRLSTDTNLYPNGFELDGIEASDVEPVAGGGFADIYKGRFQGEPVCLKTIRLYDPYQVDHLIKEYSREAILWRQLSHPNLLPFLGLFRLGSRLSFVSPWAEHGHVLKFLKENPSADRFLLCLDTAVGISYLHANNIIHGDLKAANVLVDSSGRACLADFGLSAVTDPQILHWTAHSSAASKGGSTRWQAPELHDDSGESVVHNTPASDIYAWGCTCYEIFTEHIPFFEWRRVATVISKVSLGARPSQPSRLGPSWTEWGLTDGMWDLMSECWKHLPNERPDISDITERLSLEKPVDTRSPGRWEGLVTQFRDRNPQLPSQKAVQHILSRILP